MSINKLKNKIENRFILTVLASKRAREIRSYKNAQKYMRKCKYPEPFVLSDSTIPLTIAFEEIAEGKIFYKETKETKE